MTPRALTTAAACALLIASSGCGTTADEARSPLQPADTVPSSTYPPITYESYGPGPTEWLPLTINIPTTITVGQTFTITGTCLAGLAGEPAGVGIYYTPTADPPAAQWAGGAGWTSGGAAHVQPDGSFSQTLTATVPSGVYYFRPSCAEESWEDDALYPDGNGGTIKRYYEYPESQLRAVTVVAAAPTTTTGTGGGAVTIPPTR